METNLTNSPQQTLLGVVLQRAQFLTAWCTQTGLTPDKAVMCLRREEDGTIRTWYESAQELAPIEEQFRKAVVEARFSGSLEREIATGRALLIFATAKGLHNDLILEASVNLNLL